MTSNPSPIMNALALASAPGLTQGPTALLTALEAHDAPLKCLAGGYGTESIRAAIEEDFGFLHLLRMRSVDASSVEMERWAALMRWLITTVKDWKPSEDPSTRLLAAAVVTSRMCGGDIDLWQLLGDGDTPSTEFLAALSLLVSKSRVVFGARGHASLPIWESEFVDAFQAADASGDWAAIADMWPRLDHVFSPDILLTEMARCLARHDFAGLVRAADALQQTPLIMQLAHALAVDQRLRLAITSTSERVRFCCAFVTVARGTGAPPLASDEQAALSELLVQVAGRPEEWRKWMTVFNTYPLRYPALHHSLGDALACASQNASTIYIDSIKLYPIRITDTDESRSLICECLRVFGSNASPEHRRAVWAQAYRRWLDWRFGAADLSNHLSDVNWSPIDFAIVSYACECMSVADRDKAIADLQNATAEIELTWRKSDSQCITEWNRILSLFQPYAHARHAVDAGFEILSTRHVYYPFDVSQSLYHRIMFRIPAHIGALSGHSNQGE